MAKEKLIVKNFGPIKDAELDLGKVTVFIGEQASGKSVLAKLIRIFRDAEFFYENSTPKSKKEIFEIYSISEYFNTNSTLWFESDLYQIKYAKGKFQCTEKESFKQGYAKSLNKNYGSDKLEILAAASHLDELVEGIQKTNSKSSQSKSKIGANRRKMEEILKADFMKTSVPQPLYIPAERQLISLISDSILSLLDSEVNLPKFIIRFGSIYEKAIKKEIDIPFGLESIIYSRPHQKSENYITYKGTKTRLNQSSSGLQSLLPMLLVIEYYSNNTATYIVEEPELNLYPSNQKDLVNFLIAKCTKKNDHLIVTTHSPYILSSLDNLIQAGNVVKKHPELKAEVEKIIPAKYHLNYEDVKVYFVADGTARLIMNEEYQSIDVSELDDVSEDLNADFEKLLELKYQD